MRLLVRIIHLKVSRALIFLSPKRLNKSRGRLLLKFMRPTSNIVHTLQKENTTNPSLTKLKSLCILRFFCAHGECVSQAIWPLSHEKITLFNSFQRESVTSTYSYSRWSSDRIKFSITIMKGWALFFRFFKWFIQQLKCATQTTALTARVQAEPVLRKVLLDGSDQLSTPNMMQSCQMKCAYQYDYQEGRN